MDECNDFFVYYIMFFIFWFSFLIYKTTKDLLRRSKAINRNEVTKSFYEYRAIDGKQQRRLVRRITESGPVSHIEDFSDLDDFKWKDI